jgi:hypothetical protein
LCRKNCRQSLGLIPHSAVRRHVPP